MTFEIKALAFLAIVLLVRVKWTTFVARGINKRAPKSTVPAIRPYVQSHTKSCHIYCEEKYCVAISYCISIVYVC